MTQQLYQGTIKYPTSEPRETKWGVKVNVVIDMDDDNAPKANEYGSVRLYKKVDTVEADYMQTLIEGDRVQLVYTDDGSRSYYSLLVPSDFSKQEKKETTAPSPKPNGSTDKVVNNRKTGLRVWYPNTPEQSDCFLQVAKQEGLLLTALYDAISTMNSELPETTKWAMTATAYISARDKWSPQLITQEQMEEMQDYDDQQSNKEQVVLGDGTILPF